MPGGSYDDLLLQGEETIKINAILIGQVRLLLQASILMKVGYQQANIAETLISSLSGQVSDAAGKKVQ